MDAVGTMVRMVVPAPEPSGVSVAGAKMQDSPAGKPPLQAKETVERKPPVGVTVKVTALEVAPTEAVAVGVDAESVKEPTGARMVKVAADDVLGRWAASPV